MKIEIFWRRNWRGKFRYYFRLVAVNGETLAQSEAYNRMADCEHTAALIKTCAGAARIVKVRS